MVNILQTPISNFFDPLDTFHSIEAFITEGIYYL